MPSFIKARKPWKKHSADFIKPYYLIFERVSAKRNRQIYDGTMWWRLNYENPQGLRSLTNWHTKSFWFCGNFTEKMWSKSFQMDSFLMTIKRKSFQKFLPKINRHQWSSIRNLFETNLCKNFDSSLGVFTSLWFWWKLEIWRSSSLDLRKMSFT